MKTATVKSLFILALFFSTCILQAQTTNKFDFTRIEDNSFLLEEAYNQEPGVIQHISAFQYMRDKTWAYTFTEEWPVKSQRHQVSVTLPVLKYSIAYIGNVALNYRYQAILTDRWAFSPRFSLLLPTGTDKRYDVASSAFRFQTNMPLSFVCSRRLVTHFNVGYTYAPYAEDIMHTVWSISDLNYGASAIVLLSENFNFMFEVAGTSRTDKIKKTEIHYATGDVYTNKTLFINPGFRYAINFKSGLQIVPGVSVPVGIGPSSNEYGIFGYLSFEHPLKMLQ